MKLKPLFLFFSGLIISMVVNSCKKDNSGTIQTLFTGGSWQLASVLVTNYVGSEVVSYDTLNTTCDSTQVFTFNSNNTCTYTNFDCVPQKIAQGNWGISHDQLFLMANMTCTDTIPGGKTSTSQPFANAQIMNLGQYSMVLETGNINTYFTATTKRTITTWGFVRVTTTAGN